MAGEDDAAGLVGLDEATLELLDEEFVGQPATIQGRADIVLFEHALLVHFAGKEVVDHGLLSSGQFLLSCHFLNSCLCWG